MQAQTTKIELKKKKKWSKCEFEVRTAMARKYIKHTTTLVNIKFNEHFDQ